MFLVSLTVDGKISQLKKVKHMFDVSVKYSRIVHRICSESNKETVRKNIIKTILLKL